MYENQIHDITALQRNSSLRGVLFGTATSSYINKVEGRQVSGDH